MRHPAVHAFCVWLGTGCVPRALSFDPPTSIPSLVPQRMPSIPPQYLSLRQAATVRHQDHLLHDAAQTANRISAVQRGGNPIVRRVESPVPLGSWWYRWQSGLLRFHKWPALVPLTLCVRYLFRSLCHCRDRLGVSLCLDRGHVGAPSPPNLILAPGWERYPYNGAHVVAMAQRVEACLRGDRVAYMVGHKHSARVEARALPPAPGCASPGAEISALLVKVVSLQLEDASPQCHPSR